MDVKYIIRSITKNNINQIHFFWMRLRFSFTDFSEKKIINPITEDNNPIGFIIQPYIKILPNEKNKFLPEYLLSAKHKDDEMQKKANIIWAFHRMKSFLKCLNVPQSVICANSDLNHPNTSACRRNVSTKVCAKTLRGNLLSKSSAKVTVSRLSKRKRSVPIEGR